MPSKGHIGTSLGGTESSPERKKRDAAKRKRQERRWAAKSGEVRVTVVDPEKTNEKPVAADQSTRGE